MSELPVTSGRTSSALKHQSHLSSSSLEKNNLIIGPSVVIHTFSLSSWEAEADGLVQPSLPNETLSPERKKKVLIMCVSLYVGMCT